MASPEKANFLMELTQRYGQPVKLPGSQSLYDLPSNNVTIHKVSISIRSNVTA